MPIRRLYNICDMNFEKVGVYLSAREGLPESYTAAAREVGELIGSTGRTLVYGGSRCGLMEILAQGVKRTGGRVYGMVPDIIAERGLVSEAVDVTFRCADLTDRKAAMERESDIFVALPGGLGTLDEIFSVLGNACIGIRRKPVVFYNAGRCWDKLLTALDALHAAGLIVESPSTYYKVVDNVTALRAVLDGK